MLPLSSFVIHQTYKYTSLVSLLKTIDNSGALCWAFGKLQAALAKNTSYSSS